MKLKNRVSNASMREEKRREKEGKKKEKRRKERMRAVQIMAHGARYRAGECARKSSNIKPKLRLPGQEDLGVGGHDILRAKKRREGKKKRRGRRKEKRRKKGEKGKKRERGQPQGGARTGEPTGAAGWTGGGEGRACWKITDAATISARQSKVNIRAK